MISRQAGRHASQAGQATTCRQGELPLSCGSSCNCSCLLLLFARPACLRLVLAGAAEDGLEQGARLHHRAHAVPPPRVACSSGRGVGAHRAGRNPLQEMLETTASICHSRTATTTFPVGCCTAHGVAVNSRRAARTWHASPRLLSLPRLHELRLRLLKLLAVQVGLLQQRQLALHQRLLAGAAGAAAAAGGDRGPRKSAG